MPRQDQDVRPGNAAGDGRLIAGPRPIFQMGGDWVVGQFEK